jgi:hypothetical protein
MTPLLEGKSMQRKKNRCRSKKHTGSAADWHGYARCILPSGHEGNHSAGFVNGIVWDGKRVTDLKPSEIVWANRKHK